MQDNMSREAGSGSAGKKAIIIILILVAVGGIGFWLMQQDQVNGTGESSSQAPAGEFSHVPSGDELKANMSKAGLEQLGTEGQVLHIHQHLDITVNGSAVEVPANLGVSNFYISPLHTHDTSGIIHVESPVVKDFTLGQFFDQWGVQLSSTCIGTNCVSDQTQLIVAVNGQRVEDPRNYVLKAHDEIQVWFGPKSETPTLKKDYQFPPGE